MLEFPSMEQARRWYDSEDYRELKQLRLAATVANGFFMNGVHRVRFYSENDNASFTQTTGIRQAYTRPD